MKLDDIRALPDPFARVERLFVRLAPLAQEERFLAMPAAAQRFFSVYEWIGELNNGGVHQYFSNSSGDRWPLAHTALRGLGHAPALAAFEAALAVFPNAAPPGQRGLRNRALDALDDAARAALDAVGEAESAARDGTMRALAAFIDAHADALRFIDVYPSGLKAVERPPGVTMADVRAAHDPFDVVTHAFYLVVDQARADDAARTFLDAFAVLDEVSAGGHAAWFLCAASARSAEHAAALDAVGAARAAERLRRAVTVGAGAEDELRALDRAHQDERSEMVATLAVFVRRTL